MSQESGIVQATLTAEIRDLMVEAKRLRDGVESAKTSTKKNYFKKKLKINNQKAMQALAGLQQLELVKQAQAAQHAPVDNVSDN